MLHSSLSNSPGFLPGLLKAVRAWAGSTEIAAASVTESGVDALRPMQENGPVLQALEVLSEQKEEVDGEAAPDFEMPAEATRVSGDAETPDVEGRPDEATAPTVEEEEEAVSESEAPLEEEDAPVGKELQPEERADAEELSAEEALDLRESSQWEDGTQTGNAAHATKASVVSEEEAPREAGSPEEEDEEAALIGEGGHLAEADSGSDEIIPAVVKPLLTVEAPVNDAGHCGSCHASDNARKGVAPPAGFEAEVQKRESIGLAAEANEGVSAVDGKRKMNTQMSHVVFCDVHKCDVDIQSSHLKGGLFVHLHNTS